MAALSLTRLNQAIASIFNSSLVRGISAMFNSSVSTSKSLAVEAVYLGFNSSALAKLVVQ